MDAALESALNEVRATVQRHRAQLGNTVIEIHADFTPEVAETAVSSWESPQLDIYRVIVNGRDVTRRIDPKLLREVEVALAGAVS